MKRKSPGRLKSELRKKLRPEVGLPTLAGDISEFLDKHAGKSARNQNLANNLATYLTQTYSITDRKRGELDRMIERHPDDAAAFLDEISFKEAQAFVKRPGAHLRPTSFPDLLSALISTPDKLSPSQSDAPLPEHESRRRKKRRRARPKTENERARRRKEAKDRYDERRSHYRRGLIVEDFGK